MSYVPGRSLVTHSTRLNGVLLTLVTVVGSIALTALLATTTLWLHIWGPLAVFYLEAAGSCASILVGLWKRRRLYSESRLSRGRHVADGVRYVGFRDAFRAARRGRRGTRAADAAVQGGSAAFMNGIRPSRTDVLPVVGILLFGLGIADTQLSRIDRWGLLPALPIVFYVGFGLLIASTIWLLSRRQLPSARLAVHLATLVLMIAGTPALVYPVPRYPWL